MKYRPLILISIMLAMFMSAIEATIVTTALPSIAAELGGFSLYSWVFSVYLFMQAVTVPIYGKLADLYGRKPVFTFGVITFLVGSILCGFAPSMFYLIIFRFIQGLGAGAVQPIAMTIVGDIYSLEERGKIQGYLASVWGFSAIIGPTLGGFLVEFVDWSWVFWINLPIGIIALLGILVFLKEEFDKKQHKIDYVGTTLLVVFISALMAVLLRGGVTWPWLSGPIFILLFMAGFAFLLFIMQEKRAEDPLMPMWIWKYRVILIANVVSLITGILLMGISNFLPTFVQGVMERTPKEAGFVLAVMSIGWPIASTIASKTMMKFGFRNIAWIGTVFLILGSSLFLFLNQQNGVVFGSVGAFLVGIGMGLTNTIFTVAIQSSVEWRNRGVVTASNMFMRMMGTTIGASLFGGIINMRMIQYLENLQISKEMDLNLDITNNILDPDKRKELSSDVVQALQDGLTFSLHTVYLIVFALAILSFIFVKYMPKVPTKVK
ncbi:MDR family MFS transporter [Chengkuizengella axinellae]|uniref:MDR family MFS transporter n=1 Tax=Chengkuizengella axinellae TaxID=3064388 RepID=A0ABT9J284_9BACL|nr:MDR family MFS transporter [Chengkuizengella sp. 2205SS18-9]MDP5275726.1 MDR family MFS transporter [Chengkuizengella sp. 2205SS18-9]